MAVVLFFFTTLLLFPRCVLSDASSAKTHVKTRSTTTKFEQDLRTLSDSLTFYKNEDRNILSVLGDADASETPDTSRERKGIDAARGQSMCYRDVSRIVQGYRAGERCAVTLIDSWGKPGPSLLEGWFNLAGNYDQCRDVTVPRNLTVPGEDSFDGNYCHTTLVNVVETSNVSREYNVLQLGTCMPDSCNEESVTNVLNAALVSLNISSLFVASTECRDDDRDYSAASVFAIVLFSIIGLFMILGTIFDILYIQMPKWEKEKTSTLLGTEAEYAADGTTPISKERQKASGVGFDQENLPLLASNLVSDPNGGIFGAVQHILVAFSVYTNGANLFNTKRHKAEIGCIDGLRFFSATWVIMLHTYMFGSFVVLDTTDVFKHLIDKHFYDVVFNSFFSVDTFFTLSGFLVSYLKSKELLKKGMVINWKLFYFHRIWRLTPPYMLCLLFFLGLTRFMGSGALWPNTMPIDKKDCEDNWWTNLFYINNLVHQDKPCHGQSWYLSADMQFYIISPLLFLPLFFKQLKGAIVSLAVLIASWTTIIALAVSNDWVATDFSNQGVAEFTAEDRWKYYYVAPYCRIGPFVIGILAGYFLATNGGKVEMSKPVVCVGWLVAFATGLLVVFGVHGNVEGDDLSDKGVAAIYMAFSRSAWGLAIAWIIIACTSGYGGPINDFLSWTPFMVLGRLSYMMYLTHLHFLFVYYFNLERPFYVTDLGVFSVFLSVTAFTIMASVVFVLAVEIPFARLEKIFLGKH